MALDKQKILNELGNVVNQLQSADCGHMGKLSTNCPNGGYKVSPAMHSLPTCGGCRRGCCHGHGYGSYRAGTPCAGEPYTMAQPCGGQCSNAPKLYADTYNYLSHNLMQPVVKEVYDDLKSISPANTIMNNPMAAQMGLSPQGFTGQGGMGAPTNQGENMGNQMQSINRPMSSLGVGQRSPQMGYQNMNSQQMGSAQVNQPMGFQQMNDQPMGNHQQQMGYQQQHMGNQQQLMNSQYMQMNQHQMPMTNQIGNQQSITTQNPQMGGEQMGGMGPQIMNMFNGESNKGRPTGGHVTELNTMQAPQGGMQNPGGMTPGQYNTTMGMSNPGNQQIQSPMTQMTPQTPKAASPYVQNTMTYNASMSQGNASNANYQMNASPASQQMAAANKSYGQHTQGVMKFNEMFPGVMGSDLGFDPMAIALQMNPANQQKVAMDTMQKLMTGQGVNKVPDTNVSGQMQSAITGANAAVAALNPPPINQQPVSNQEPMAAQQIPPQTIQSPQYVPPRTTRLPLPASGYPASGLEPEPDQYVRDPIYPVDVPERSPSPVRPAKYMKSYEYNTLGQPVEMLPARLYHTPYEANVPQTLSPQPVTRLRNDIDRYNVKPTISKTALIGNKPLGRTPSRSQLQHIYNQYKGSQSYTQQNISPPVQGVSYSERRLNVQGNAQNARPVPVERVGGDTVANNQVTNQVPVKNMPQQQIGDVPAAVNKPHGDIIPTKEPSPLKHTKLRNGLQDMVYTSYPTTAAWSFHGHGRPSTAGRYRGRGFY